jgi:ATP-dependent helicase/nuclease subunit B
MRHRAWRALSYRNHAKLSPEIVDNLFKSPLEASVTRIEAFATCPFKHFARYALRLEQREEQDVTAMDLGNVYHQILERIVRELVDQKRDWRTTEPQFTDAQIKHFAREIGQSLRGELMLSSARNEYLLGRIEQTLTRVVAAQQAMLRRGGFQPHAAEVEFGTNGSVPALTLQTPKGNTVRLRGKIDRVDVLEDAASFAVIDYKLADRPLALANVYHGLSLQLLTYLLVLQANGEELFGKPMTPAAAFYVKLLRKLDNVEHPDDAVAPDDPLFDLQVKPRGLFDGRFFQDLDSDCQGGASDVVQAYLTKGGTFGRLDTTDVASQRQFDALLMHVRKRIGALADALIGGDSEVRPFRIGKVTPCPTCEYRSVCRFEPGVNRYYNLERISRTEVLERVAGSGADHEA